MTQTVWCPGEHDSIYDCGVDSLSTVLFQGRSRVIKTRPSTIANITFDCTTRCFRIWGNTSLLGKRGNWWLLSMHLRIHSSRFHTSEIQEQTIIYNVTGCNSSLFKLKVVFVRFDARLLYYWCPWYIGATGLWVNYLVTRSFQSMRPTCAIHYKW